MRIQTFVIPALVAVAACSSTGGGQDSGALPADTGVVSSYKKYPACGHSLCGSALCGRTDTLAWLKAQGW